MLGWAYSDATTGCLAGVDDLLDYDMSNSVPIEVVKMLLYGSADL